MSIGHISRNSRRSRLDSDCANSLMMCWQISMRVTQRCCARISWTSVAAAASCTGLASLCIALSIASVHTEWITSALSVLHIDPAGTVEHRADRLPETVPYRCDGTVSPYRAT